MRFAKELYPKIALIKSAYSFTDRAYVHLDADETHYIVSIRAKEGFQEVTEDEFSNEMLAQCARHEVYLQTKTLRELLVARAMASTVIELPDETYAAIDMEGYSSAAQEDEAQASEILADWFEANEDAKA